MEIKASGDRGVIVSFGNEIKKEIHYIVRDYMHLITEENYDFVEEVIPSYTSVLINYKPEIINFNDLEDVLIELNKKVKVKSKSDINIIHIPVIYGGDYGPDIEFVAEYNNITQEEVIQIHSERNYLIYMLGFTPGFSFLGGMSDKIATPRLDEPRTKIKAGSVGIAGSQTGIYPIESPGGWRLIGRTPIKLFSPEEENPVLLKMGDYIKFEPINEEEYFRILDDIKNNTYKIKVTRVSDYEPD